jgi:hypothetical protein
MKTLHYLFNKWWETVKRGKSNKKLFLNFLKMLGLEVKCLFLTGRTLEELYDE